MSLDVFKPVLYGLLNVFSASGVVFANKAVFQKFDFRFTYSLTLIHIVVTMLGMWMMTSAFGVFPAKQLPLPRIIPLSAAFVAYIVFCNLNLQLNTVGFYQITKIAVAPAVLLLEWLMFGKKANVRVLCAIALVCLGISLSTLTDMHMGASGRGLAVGSAAVAATALYQIFAGSKQKELRASSMQLLHQFSPVASVMLATLVCFLEPLGILHRDANTLLGYDMTPAAAAAIGFSAILGLFTVIILTGGCLIFGEEMPWKRLLGICMAMAGIIWYSFLKLQEFKQQQRTQLPSRQGDGVGLPPPLWRQGLEAWDTSKAA